MKLYSWGSNSHGQLGQGSEAEQILLPIPLDFNIEPKFITGGGKHTILLSSTGEIFSCGDNDKGQLGKDLNIKLVNIFQHLRFQFKVSKISCGWDFNLVLTEDGDVFGWGSNSFGQLGLAVDEVKCLSVPQKIFLNKAVDIGTGLRHSGVVTSSGLVFTTGFGRKGQLGVILNEIIPVVVDKFTLVENIRNCLEISCGECHCITKTANGEFYSWGNNKYGQLGIDPATVSFSGTPVEIVVPTVIDEISHLFSGWAHNFILTGQGQILSWGRNDFGQLGEQRKHNWKPQLIKNMKKIKQISVGSHHSVILTDNGRVFTWGWNEHGNCASENCKNVFKPYNLKEFSEVQLVGSGAAHSFLSTQYNRMYTTQQTKILEIENPDVNVFCTDEIKTGISVIERDLDYSTFFRLFLLPNKPCIINNATENWPCVTKWVKNKSLNTEFFRKNLKNVDVPVSDCGKRKFNVQKKCSLKLFDYMNYWEDYKKCSKGKDCLYLKDWHFMKEFPHENVYRVPPYFASDWLNEYYDNNPQLNDDYRFVYIGPKDSWTPFHADVFTSYSWSVNICGRKKWVLFPPGTENYFRDKLGNLTYDIDMSILNGSKDKKKIQSFEVIQEEGQGLFVPSGWHHQVWNLEDTISINHNWINGCNIHYIWDSLQKNLSAVMNEISDCKEMENWVSQCQLVLSASFGFDYQFFYSFLVQAAERRIDALKANKNLNVFGDWCFGEKHMMFDLKQILNILIWLEKDENFLEIAKTEDSLNHAVEFLDSLSAFLKLTFDFRGNLSKSRYLSSSMQK